MSSVSNHRSSTPARSSSPARSSAPARGNSPSRRARPTPPSSPSRATDRATITREASSSPRSQQGVQNLTQGLQNNFSTPTSNFREEVARDYQTVAGVTDRVSQGIAGVEGAAAGAQRGGTPSTSAAVNRAVERSGNVLSRVAPAARVAGPIATVASGAYETLGHTINPNLSAGERTEAVSGAAGATGGAWGGGILGAKGGVALGAAAGSVVPIVGTAAGALVGGAVGAIGGAIVGSEVGRGIGRRVGRGINWAIGR